jgi:hypothetical protein
MYQDPIVAEVRRHREALLEQYGGDLRKLFEELKKRESESGARVVRLPPKRPAGWQSSDEEAEARVSG